MLTGLQWRILVLLFISSFLNYVDRSNLSVGAIDIQRELNFSSYQLGILLSAFFLTYATFQLFMIAGWFVDRFDVRWVFAIGFFIWSSATAVTGIVHSFAVIYAMRLLLGMGESISFPSYSRILGDAISRSIIGVSPTRSSTPERKPVRRSGRCWAGC